MTLAALVVSAVISGLALATGPAQAQNFEGVTMEVQTGIANTIRPGRPSVVQITIRSDRLVEATLLIQAPFLNQHQYQVDIEVAGGTTKDYLVAVDVDDVIEATLTDAGTTLASSRTWPNRAWQQELIGVMPDLAGSHPATLDHSVDLSPAHVGPIDHRWLGLGAQSLTGLDAIVATATDLAGLTDSELGELKSWIAIGGTLVLDEAAGSDPHLGITVSETGSAYGDGRIVATAGALKRGDWDGVVPPSPIDESGGEWGGGFWFGEPIETELARQTGFELPTVPGVIGVLGAYVLIVGPVLWLLLRRRNQLGLLWFAVPGLAVLFTGAIWVAGSALRSDVRDAQAMLIDISQTPDGPRAQTHEVIVMAPRRGGEVSVDLPLGWRPASARSDFGPTRRSSVISQREGVLRLTQSIDDGGSVAIHATGPADAFDRLVEVAATTSSTGEVQVTVTNNLDVALQNVALVHSGREAQLLGDIAPGQTVFEPFEASHRAQLGNPVIASLWPEMNRFGPAGRSADESDSLVSAGLLNLYRPSPETESIDLLGWTEGLDSMLRPGVDPGPALIVAHARIERPSESSAPLGATQLRSPQTLIDGEDFGPNRFVLRWLWRFDAAGADSSRLFAEIDGAVHDLEVWSAALGRWLKIKDPDKGLWSVDPSVVHHGAVTIKIGRSEDHPFNGQTDPGVILRELPADASEVEIVGVLGGLTEAEA